jgi:hypothetical protein
MLRRHLAKLRRSTVKLFDILRFIVIGCGLFLLLEIKYARRHFNIQSQLYGTLESARFEARPGSL